MKSQVKLTRRAWIGLATFALLIVALIALTVGNVRLTQRNAALAEQLQQTTARVETLEQQAAEPIKTYGDMVRATLAQENQNANLILQTDERWADAHYGFGDDDSFAKNACAIAALAMVHATLSDNVELTPNEILDWAGDDYFTPDGTAWSIFPAFADKYGYTVHDLGTDIDAARPYLEQGAPVLASVKPGTFTAVGHILVLTSYSDDGIRLLDPNDNPFKRHALTAFDPADIQHDLKHLWAFER